MERGGGERMGGGEGWRREGRGAEVRRGGKRRSGEEGREEELR